MAGDKKHAGALKLNMLYFGPLGLQGGIGGSARVRNMLGVLKKLEAHTQLVSYLPEKKFRVTRQQINNYLDATAISVSSSSPKILKAPALLMIFIHGLKHIRQSDAVLAHSPSIVYGFPALILAKIFRKPLLIDLTDFRDPDTPAFIYRFVLRHSSVVFAVSRYLVAVAKEAGCPEVVHAPGFIDANVFRSNALERAKIREKLNIGNNEIAVGYVGAFSPEEGLSFLIKAFHRLSQQHDNIKLVMLGGRNVSGSDDTPRLINELALQEKVILIPPQPYESVPGYLSAFDIACSPKVDCLVNRAADPIRVYEYMSVGLPVVASAVSETANAIENGHDGFLAKPEDTDDLARVLEYVIQNMGSLQELKKKAREKVITNYTQEVFLRKLKTTLEGLIKKS